MIEGNDVDAWTGALNRVEEPTLNRRVGAAAKELWSSAYSPQKGLQGLERAYERALSARPDR